MSVSLLRIPTDNLYKFAAIVGVIMFLIGFLTMPFLYFVSEIQNYEVGRQYKLASIKMNHANRIDSIRYTQRLDSLINIERIDSLMYQMEVLHNRANLYLIKFNRLQQLNDKLRTLNLNRGPMIEVINRNIWAVLIICLGLSLGGISLSWWGFICWYRKLQKPTDIWYENLNKNNDAVDPPLKEPSPEKDV